MGKSFVKNVFDTYYLKMVVVILALLNSVPYIKHKTDLLFQIFVIWGGGCILYYFVTKWRTLQWKQIIICGLLCVAHVAAAVVNYQNKLIPNLSKSIYVILFVFALFLIGEEDREKEKKQILQICRIIVILLLIMNLLCVLSYLCTVTGYYYVDATQSNWMPIGIYGGRMWGLYNPNTCGAYAVISIVLGLFMDRMEPTKGNRVFLIVNVVIQILALTLSQSRTSTLQFLLVLLGYLFFIRQPFKSLFVNIKKYYRRIFAYLVICVASAWLILYGILPVLSGIRTWMNKDMGISIQIGEAYTEDMEELEDRVTDTSSWYALTAGRSQFWEIGIKVWSEHKIFGVGETNIETYAKPLLSEKRYHTYLNGGMHNVFFSTLAATGVFGLFSLLLLLIYTHVPMVANLIKDKNPQDAILSLLTLAMIFGDLFETRILYSKSGYTIIFWIVLGYAYRMTVTKKNSEIEKIKE